LGVASPRGFHDRPQPDAFGVGAPPGENELLAEGRSSLPPDWHALLRAPFTANFRASLADAGSLASLFGPEAAALGGSLYFDGSVRGADNKAEGYCNFSGMGTKFRRLTVDWVKGCLLFDGATTRISHVDAAAGRDAISLSGSLENARPHAYRGEAEVSVKDLSRRLGELGLTVSPVIGAGALAGSWKGEGDAAAHRGEFRARFTEWVSRWTKGGLSGNVEGSYAPDSLKITKAQMIKKDLTLSLGVVATPQRLEITSISVDKAASKKPLATGRISLPLNLVDFWSGGDPVGTLAMDQPSTVTMQADGLRIEQLADLLGQSWSCSGKLEGWFAAGGTPSSPELNASVAIGGFSPDAGAPSGDLSLTVQTFAGETTATIHQENKAEILHGEWILPIRLAKSGGTLVPERSAKLRGSVRLREMLLDGWIPMLAGSSALPLRTVMVGGEVTVSGTVGQPLAQGRLDLKVAKADLCGPYRLEDLTLPLAFSNTTATLGNGIARFRGEPVTLTGSADWASGATAPKLSLGIRGTNLPVDLAPGLSATATADLHYMATPSLPTMLGGTLLVDPIRSDLGRSFVPVFCPPGFQMASSPGAVGWPDAPRLDPGPCHQDECAGSGRAHGVGQSAPHGKWRSCGCRGKLHGAQPDTPPSRGAVRTSPRRCFLHQGGQLPFGNRLGHDARGPRRSSARRKSGKSVGRDRGGFGPPRCRCDLLLYDAIAPFGLGHPPVAGLAAPAPALPGFGQVLEHGHEGRSHARRLGILRDTLGLEPSPASGSGGATLTMTR